MSRRWDTLEVDGTPMRCYLTLPNDAPAAGTPAAGTPAAGLLECLHAPGVDDFILGICDRLANAGFAAIAPDLYHRQTEPQDNPLKRMAHLKDAEIVTDLGSALTHLRGLGEIDAMRTAVVGFCMGGRLAYVPASEDPSLSAAVVFYCGNMIDPCTSGTSFTVIPTRAMPSGTTRVRAIAQKQRPTHGRGASHFSPSTCDDRACRAPRCLAPVRVPRWEAFMSRKVKIPGIGHPFEIVWDRWGIPHVFAKSVDDAYAGMGFVAGHERLWQAHLSCLYANAQAASELGAKFVRQDALMRTLDVPGRQVERRPSRGAAPATSDKAPVPGLDKAAQKR